MYDYDDSVIELDEFEEFEEAKGRPRARFRPVPVPRRSNVVPAAAPGRPVSQADLVNATRRLDEKIGVNARAIKAIEGRVNSVASENARQTKAMDAVRNDLKSLREVSTLLPLLTTQKTAKLTDGTEVVVPSNDTFSKLLPVLMLSGGLGGSGGSSSSGGDSGLGGMGLPLLLVLATQK